MLGALLDQSADLACVGVTSTVAEALDLIEVRPTDLLVLGAHPKEAVAGARALKKLQPDIGVILVTARGRQTALDQLERAGASGVLTDTSSPADILTAIQRIARSRGHGARNVPAVDGRAGEGGRHVGVHAAAKLTKRELEVLSLMGDAVPPKQIAAQLRISVHTCRDYIRSIQRKLECHSALHAVLEAQHRGLLPKSG